MRKATEQGITLTGLTKVLPFVAIMAAIIAFGYMIRTELVVLNTRVNSVDSRMEKVEDRQNTMNDSLIKIATILEGAKARGEITISKIPVLATVPPASISVVNNQPQSSAAITPVEQPTPTPTPQATPTPTPAILPCLLGVICL